MAIGQTFHGLTEVDFVALANARYTPEVIQRLAAAQFSRNALLLEAIRRSVVPARDTETADIIETATLLFSEIQKEQPDLVHRLLVLPQFGLWAANCLIRLQAAAGRPQLGDETRHELGYLAAFAASAGLLAGRPFHLRLPVRDGVAYLPTLGRMRFDGGSPGPTWAQIGSEGGGSGVLTDTGRRSLRLRLDRPNERIVGWTSASRLRVGSRGLHLSVALDGSDPFLAGLGLVSPAVSRESVQAWRHGLRRAWQVLVREDELLASAVATGLTTLVPLRQAPDGPPVSAASGWAWGAIALTLPPDPLIFAETLIHEFQHLVLSAIEDIVPLSKGDGNDLFYSPWRDDPRPFSSVLQGAYAFLGVSGFWQKKCHSGSPATRRRAEENFALRRRNVSDAFGIIAESGKLTDNGQAFVEEMQGRSAQWLADPVPVRAENFAHDIALEHELRWRFANLSPDPEAVDSLARTWLVRPYSDPRQLDIPTMLTPSSTSGLTDRSGFLERLLASSGAPTSARTVIPHGAGDIAFIRGDMAEAKTAYARAVAHGDHDAWIGLVLVLRRMGIFGDNWNFGRRIQVVAAISDRVRAMTGQSPDAQTLLMWAGRAWGGEA
jgi:HEXXH motif-containing protein